MAAAGEHTLAARVSGQGPGRPTVALVHGFAQTGECLGPLAEALEVAHRVVRVDQPGHGGSGRHRGATMERTADLLLDTTGPAALVGYSMGARAALHAAVARPAEVTALVLIGGTPGIDDDAERKARRASDEALAARIESIGVDAFVQEWLATPMFETLPRWARFDRERRSNTAEGLAASLRHAGTGAMTPVWDRLGEIRCPVLCVTGERDVRYGAIAQRMVAALGGPASHVVVPAAGHAAHLEQPEATVAAVSGFLAAHLRSR